MPQLTQTNPGILNTVITYFTSPAVTLGLFAVLVMLLIPQTFLPEYASLFLVPIKGILVLVGLNLVACTLRRRKTLRMSTLVIHLGVLVILAGGLTSTFGFIATVNVYEGASTDTVFRWDSKQDAALGFDLHVAGINVALYPVPVKVGVLKDGKKAELFLTNTEDSFVFEKYRVKILTFDPGKNNLQLAIETLDGQFVGTMDTAGRKDVPADFPLDFKLVAFQDPVVKRVWVDLELRKGAEKIVEGIAEVNNPLRWQGMQFFLTQAAADESGRGFAGIQISKDPGIPVVYSGFAILLAGILIILKRWVQ